MFQGFTLISQRLALQRATLGPFDRSGHRRAADAEKHIEIRSGNPRAPLIIGLFTEKGNHGFVPKSEVNVFYANVVICRLIRAIECPYLSGPSPGC